MKQKQQESEKIKPIHDKAIYQIRKEKEVYLEKLNRLQFNNEYSDDIQFFLRIVYEILNILNKIDDYGRFISARICDQIEKLKRQKDKLLERLKIISDNEFIDMRDTLQREMEDIEGEYTKLRPQEINWLSEINLLFDSFENEEEIQQNQPGLAEKVNKKLQPLPDRLGFEQIYPVRGTEYDPRQHLVKGERQEAGVRRGQVVKVVRRGLKKGTEVIQKAKVIIGK